MIVQPTEFNNLKCTLYLSDLYAVSQKDIGACYLSVTIRTLTESDPAKSDADSQGIDQASESQAASTTKALPEIIFELSMTRDLADRLVSEVNSDQSEKATEMSVTDSQEPSSEIQTEKLPGWLLVPRPSSPGACPLGEGATTVDFNLAQYNQLNLLKYNYLSWSNGSSNRSITIGIHNEWEWAQVAYLWKEQGLCNPHEDLGNVYPLKRAYLDKIVKTFVQAKNLPDDMRIYKSIFTVSPMREQAFNQLELLLAEAKQSEDLEGLTLLASLCELLINIDRGSTLIFILKTRFDFFFTCLSHSPANSSLRRGHLFMHFLFGENPYAAPIDFLNLYKQKENLSKIFEKDEPELQSLVEIKGKLYFLFKLVLMNNPEFADSAIEKEVNESSSVAILKELIRGKAIRKMLFENFYELKPTQLIRLINEVRGLFHEIRRKDITAGFASQLQELQVPSLCLKRVVALIDEDPAFAQLPSLVTPNAAESEVQPSLAASEQPGAGTLIGCEEMLTELFSGQHANLSGLATTENTNAPHSTMSKIENEDCIKASDGVNDTTLTPPVTNSPVIEEIKGSPDAVPEDQETQENRSRLILSYLELALMLCRENPRPAKKVFSKIDFPALVHYTLQQSDPSFLLAIKDVLFPPFLESMVQYELIDSLTEQQIIQRGVLYLETLTRELRESQSKPELSNSPSSDNSETLKKARTYLQNYLCLTNQLLKCVSLSHLLPTSVYTGPGASLIQPPDLATFLPELLKLLCPNLIHKQLLISVLDLVSQCLSSRVTLVYNIAVQLMPLVLQILRKFDRSKNLIYSKALSIWTKLPCLEEPELVTSIVQKLTPLLVEAPPKEVLDQTDCGQLLENPLAPNFGFGDSIIFHHWTALLERIGNAKATAQTMECDPVYQYLETQSRKPPTSLPEEEFTSQIEDIEDDEPVTAVYVATHVAQEAQQVITISPIHSDQLAASGIQYETTSSKTVTLTTIASSFTTVPSTPSEPDHPLPLSRIGASSSGVVSLWAKPLASCNSILARKPREDTASTSPERTSKHADENHPNLDSSTAHQQEVQEEEGKLGKRSLFNHHEQHEQQQPNEDDIENEPKRFYRGSSSADRPPCDPTAAFPNQAPVTSFPATTTATHESPLPEPADHPANPREYGRSSIEAESLSATLSHQLPSIPHTLSPVRTPPFTSTATTGTTGFGDEQKALTAIVAERCSSTDTPNALTLGTLTATVAADAQTEFHCDGRESVLRPDAGPEAPRK